MIVIVNEEEFDMRTEKKIKDAENRLFEIVWWNRHKVLEGQYKKTGEYPPKEIWDKTLENAEKIEKEIPEDERVLDDFNWGKVNGELSAIRWVLGSEWGDLSS
jgi:hypothetical protein